MYFRLIYLKTISISIKVIYSITYTFCEFDIPENKLSVVQVELYFIMKGSSLYRNIYIENDVL